MCIIYIYIEREKERYYSCMSAPIHIHMCVRVCMYVYIYIYTYTHINTHINTYMYTCICIYDATYVHIISRDVVSHHLRPLRALRGAARRARGPLRPGPGGEPQEAVLFYNDMI